VSYGVDADDVHHVAARLASLAADHQPAVVRLEEIDAVKQVLDG
jgi:hypothetical protein